MGFEIVNTFEFSGHGETAPVTKELRKSGKKIIVQFDDRTVHITLTQKETFTNKKVAVSLLEFHWDFHYNSQTNSYTATSNEKRTIHLDPDVGQFIYELIQGLSCGEVDGETARTCARLIFRELEVKHAPSNSWVREHFPKFFKQEETDIERRRKKIVRDVMKV